MREDKSSGVGLPSRVPTSLRAATVARVLSDPVELTRMMWLDVGLFRDREGLTRALTALEPAWKEMDDMLAGGGVLHPEDWRTASILTVGRLIALAALRREESRGGHYRADFPDRDDVHWKRRVLDRKS